MLLRFRVFGPTSGEFPASDSLSSIQNEGEDRFLRRSSATCSEKEDTVWVGARRLAIELAFWHGASGTEPASGAETALITRRSIFHREDACYALRKGEGAEKRCQQLRLDNPEPGAPPPSQPTPETQQNPQAKPSQTPPAAPPQKLQLETPKEAPAPQKAPELTTPVAPRSRKPSPPPRQLFSRLFSEGTAAFSRDLACPHFLASRRRV